MATIPIRDVPGEAVQPSGDELILIDNGIAMQKATINDAVTPKATEIVEDKIADLNLGTAATANIEDFATAAQGLLADSAVQPTREIIAGDGLTGGGNLSADRTISLDSTSIASLAKADTAVQSVVAGANVTIDATDPQNPIISASGGGAASTDFATVADLLADDNDKIGYAGSGADTEVLPGFIITAQGFRYEVAASDATDEHVETAGGVKLYVLGDVLRPDMFGLSADAGVDQQAVLQRMLDAGSPEIYLPAGTWRSDTSLTRSTDVCIRGPGTLDFSNGTDGQLLIQGSITALDNLNADVTKHSRTLSWAADQGLAAGDIVILWNPTDYSFGGRRDVYRDGGMFKVHSLPTATTVKTYEMAVDAYAAASMNVYKMNPVRVTIEGIRVKPCSTAELAPIKVSFGADVIIRDVKSLAGGTYGGIQIDRCYNVVYDCVTTENNSPHVNNEYGIIISNSQHVKVQGSAAFATRHAVTLGGTNSEASVPCRWVTIDGMSLCNAPASGTTSTAGDVHGNGDYVTYSNCFMTAGFGAGGRNIRLIGCTVLGMHELTSGMCVAAPEANGGYVEFIDCEFISEGDGNDSNHAYILIQVLGASASGNPAEAWIREDMYVRVKGCRFVTPNAHANAKMVAVVASNANVKVNVDVSDCDWVTPQGGMFLLARETINEAMLSDYLMVDDVRGPAGAYLIHPQPTIAAVPTREMQQRGYVDGTTTASTLLALPATAQSFRYRYSRLPTCTASVSSQTGGAQGQVGGQPASAKVYEFSSTSIRCAITAPAAFTVGANVRLHWTAGVMEV